MKKRTAPSFTRPEIFSALKTGSWPSKPVRLITFSSVFKTIGDALIARSVRRAWVEASDQVRSSNDQGDPHQDRRVPQIYQRLPEEKREVTEQGSGADDEGDEETFRRIEGIDDRDDVRRKEIPFVHVRQRERQEERRYR